MGKKNEKTMIENIRQTAQRIIGLQKEMEGLSAYAQKIKRVAKHYARRG